jgi:protein involved in polysaccharide export with SLBB domain
METSRPAAAIPRRAALAAWPLVLAAAPALASCVAPRLEPGDLATLQLHKVSVEGYRIQPGDRLRVAFAYHPTRNRMLAVRPDGRVSLTFAEEVQAAGLTIPELDAALTARVAEHLDAPDLTVEVEAHARQRVYVAGRVARPGELPLTPGMTLQEAITAAGSFAVGAARDAVVLVRADNPSSRSAIKVNADEEAMVAADVELQPFDLIYVPPSGIARVGIWIQQHINDVIPRGFRFVVLRFRLGVNIFEVFE